MHTGIKICGMLSAEEARLALAQGATWIGFVGEGLTFILWNLVKLNVTIGKMFGHVIVEESQHLGQIAYLRGLQRGLNN